MRMLTNKIINEFKNYLYEDERSDSTIEKYMRDVCRFCEAAEGSGICKAFVLEYKKRLCERYAPKSVNSILSSMNALFSFLGWHDLKVKNLKIQRKIFADKEKETSSVRLFSMSILEVKWDEFLPQIIRDAV